MGTTREELAQSVMKTGQGGRRVDYSVASESITVTGACKMQTKSDAAAQVEAHHGLPLSANLRPLKRSDLLKAADLGRGAKAIFATLLPLPFHHQTCRVLHPQSRGRPCALPLAAIHRLRLLVSLMSAATMSQSRSHRWRRSTQLWSRPSEKTSNLFSSRQAKRQ